MGRVASYPSLSRHSWLTRSLDPDAQSGLPDSNPPPTKLSMKLDEKFWLRAFLAFTTGLFLSCAARVSYGQPTTPLAGQPSVSAQIPLAR